MSINRPQHLYKYFSKDNFDFLSHFMLRYTPHESFNDPFENAPSEPEKVDCLGKDKAIALHAAMRDVSTYSKDLVDETLANKFQKDAIVLTFQDYQERLGTVCLSETHDNLLMWAHYASEHRGFAIEFDSTYFFEFADDPLKTSLFNVDRVSYREMRVADRPDNHWDYYHGTPHEIATTKSTHWSHEQEWRMQRPLNNADRVAKDDRNEGYKRDASNHLIHLFSVPKQYILKVIIGARASRENLDLIGSKLAGDDDLAHVKLKLSVPDPVNFCLRFVNIRISDLSPQQEPPP